MLAAFRACLLFGHRAWSIGEGHAPSPLSRHAPGPPPPGAGAHPGAGRGRLGPRPPAPLRGAGLRAGTGPVPGRRPAGRRNRHQRRPPGAGPARRPGPCRRGCPPGDTGPGGLARPGHGPGPQRGRAGAALPGRHPLLPGGHPVRPLRPGGLLPPAHRALGGAGLGGGRLLRLPRPAARTRRAPLCAVGAALGSLTAWPILSAPRCTPSTSSADTCPAPL
jgi:hypothetical protein